MGGNCVLLSGEDAILIKKTIDENKEWFESIFESITPWEKDFMVSKKFVWAHIRGLPLNLWSRHSLESIVSMVGTLVEIDKDTLEMEELEFARVLIKLPVARDVRWTHCMKVNETMCQIAIEEEPVNKVEKSHFGDWKSNSDYGDLESLVGRECGASEESEFGSNLFFHGGVGEETTVEEAEELLRREAQNQRAATAVRRDDVEGHNFSGLQNGEQFNEAINVLGGQDGCFNEVGDKVEGLSSDSTVALNEVGGQRQTLIEIKKSFYSYWAP